MTDYYPTKKKIMIVEEIKRWIQDVLSVPSDHFNGLPPCPYAKAAWVNNDVKIAFGTQHDVMNICDEWDNQEASLVIVVIEGVKKELSVWCEERNTHLAFENLTLMSFVPDDTIDTGQPEEEMMNWEPLTDEEYSMVFVQELTELETASAHLMSKGYYKNCTEQFMNYVNARSERASHAFEEENEEACDEEAGCEEAGYEKTPQEEEVTYGKEEEAGFVREHPRETETHQGGQRGEDAETGKQGSANEQGV